MKGLIEFLNHAGRFAFRGTKNGKKIGFGDALAEDAFNKVMNRDKYGRIRHAEPYCTVSPKNKYIALIFCIFFGVVGLHKFYVDKPYIGLLYFITLGFCGVAPIIDIVLILTNHFKDSEGLPLVEPGVYESQVNTHRANEAWNQGYQNYERDYSVEYSCDRCKITFNPLKYNGYVVTCPNCGDRKVRKINAAPPIKCELCGNVLRPDAKFCPKCGMYRE